MNNENFQGIPEHNFWKIDKKNKSPLDPRGRREVKLCVTRPERSLNRAKSFRMAKISSPSRTTRTPFRSIVSILVEDDVTEQAFCFLWSAPLHIFYSFKREGLKSSASTRYNFIPFSTSSSIPFNLIPIFHHSLKYTFSGLGPWLSHSENVLLYTQTIERKLKYFLK